MCDDQQSGHQPEIAGSGLSRRNFLHGTAAVAAATALFREIPRLPLRSAARPVASDGGAAYSMAMHVHSSFSEFDGSMQSQLFQAAANTVDVLWWTDHDFRMEGTRYRDIVHFTSLDHEKGGPGQGGPWKWEQVESGPLTVGSGGGIVSVPCSPNDPVFGGSMHLTAKSTSQQTAKFGYLADSQHAQFDYQDNLTGQTLEIDVLLESGWQNGYLELLITTSYHEAAGLRPAGNYSLSYRFVPDGAASRTALGNMGVITIPVKSAGGHNWYTATLTPSDDIAALWPDLDYRDFSLYLLTLSAASEGDQVNGYFDYLRFNRSLSGDAAFQQQAEMAGALALQYPSVQQQQGLEVSLDQPHMSWFGTGVAVPDYNGVGLSNYTQFLTETVVPQIHANDGLVSYNHPFGASFFRPPFKEARQDQMLVATAQALLPGPSRPAALGADLLEVGYPLREGCDLAHHVALWDIMSRNAIFLTGNGTSDDHWGQNWFGEVNNWITWAWAATSSQASLLAALAAGRAWCGSLSGFRGSLDLLVDGSSPMGSVSISKAATRQAALTATSVPAGGSVQLLQGTVDYAGTSALAANTRVIASYPARDLASGSVTTSVDNSRGSFIRSQVLNSGGATVGLSNPAWLLRSPPPGGIPAARAA